MAEDNLKVLEKLPILSMLQPDTSGCVCVHSTEYRTLKREESKITLPHLYMTSLADKMTLT